MPFRVATLHSVTPLTPQLLTAGSFWLPGEPVSSWDYLAEVRIEGGLTVLPEEFLDETGLGALHEAHATLQVDCPATGFRNITAVPLVAAPPHDTRLALDIAPNTLAEQIEVRLGIVLHADRSPGSLTTAATRAGSRIFTAPDVHRFYLEGSGAGFPTEAFPFAPAGYPDGAAWMLSCRGDSLDANYSTSVRLFINTNHERAPEILAGKGSGVQSVLFHSILEQMFLMAAELGSSDPSQEFEEGTVGAVLDTLSQMYLHQGLAKTINALRNDRWRTLASIQHATGFLKDWS